MPRLANPPTGQGRPATKQTLATPQQGSPVKLSLNDDRGEKAARFQSRQALHDIQINQIHHAASAAASPMRKPHRYEKSQRAVDSSPRTPRSAAAVARDEDRRGGGGGGGGEGEGGRGPRSVPGAVSPSGPAQHHQQQPSSLAGGLAVTPMKRVPILANFEEWMKMATDNKINATNSWNFALIDYFHDMSLLKEGDGVNFQKASCTLDGCVKIYTSRVDSVATETGKLLSGLADSGGRKKGRGDAEDGEGGESGDDEDGEEGGRKKGKRKVHRSHEQTLAPSFASLQLKKLELEFTVDPLFKKASADFDEGGARGLLLNHLSIDSEGRIVFDSSDDTTEVRPYPNTTQMQQTLVDPNATPGEDMSKLSSLPDDQTPGQQIDLTSLAAKFFPDLSILDSQDICPSMKSFALGDPNSDLDLPLLRASDDWRESHKNDNDDNRDTAKPPIDIPMGDRSGIFLNSENAAGFDDDDDIGGPLGGFDVGPDVGFGEGGEAWAKEAALEPMLHIAPMDEGGDRGQGGTDGMAIGDFDPANPDSDAYAVGLNHRPHQNDRNGEATGDPTDNILSYFDATLKSSKAASWAGPEHWRVRKIKAAAQSASDNVHPAPSRPRKEKEVFEIDFLGAMDQSLAEMLYTPAASNAAISLPKSQWKSKGRNLLPDDRHFNSRSLLQLWLKPKARVGRRRRATQGFRGREDGEQVDRHTEMDEAYWAQRRGEDDRARREEDELQGEQGKGGDYDANFFADDDDNALPFGPGLPDDDDDDDDDGLVGFTDAREMLSPDPVPPQTEGTAPPPPPQASEPPPSSSSQTNEDYRGMTGSTGFLPTSFGSQLINGGNQGRLLRPEYVNYARVAKKVDVRRLKENMWRGMAASLIASTTSPAPAPAPAPDEVSSSSSSPPPPPSPDRDLLPNQASTDGAETAELKFTSLIHNLTSVYPERQMRDISTSYCFICLLHLANEKGLVLEGGSGGGEDSERKGERGGGGVYKDGDGDEVMTGVGEDEDQDQDQDEGVDVDVDVDVEQYDDVGMDEITVRRDLSVGVGYVGE